MGLKPVIGDGGRSAESGRGAPGNGSLAVASPAPLGVALTTLLGSEDTLFRDPFADFRPSDR